MNEDLANLLEQQKALLVAVSTGGPRIQDKQKEYSDRRLQIRNRLAELGFPDPIPYGDLWQWYGKWSDGSLPTYHSRRQFIGELLQSTIDSLLSGSPPEPPLPALTKQSPATYNLDVFVSHSGADSNLAGSLAQLLRNAFNLSPERIRCTSVDGFRLEVGADTNERLRVEVREARAFLGIVTRNSIRSTYVLFEMGARWGAGQYFAPVLAGGLSPGELRAPLSGLNALDLTSRAQVSQLLDNLSEVLGVHLVTRAAYEDALSVLVQSCSAPIFDPHNLPFDVVSATWGASGSEVDVTEIVRSQIRNGRLVTQAHGSAFTSEDPAVGRPKRLVVCYTVGGVEKSIAIPDGAADCIP